MTPGLSEVQACHQAAVAAGGGDWLRQGGVFLAGLLGMIMPCTVQMAVVLASLLADPKAGTFESSDANQTVGGGPAAGSAIIPDNMRSAPARGRFWWCARVLGFLAGYATTFLVTVSLAALLVQGAGWVLGSTTLQVVGGMMLAVLGLQMLGGLRLPGGGPCRGPLGFFLGRSYRRPPGPGKLGVSFALYCAGCCGPAAVGSALLLAGAGSALRAGLLLLGYGLGMAIPFMILAVGIVCAFRTLKSALRYAPVFSAAGGALALVMGLLLALRPVKHLFTG